VGRSRDWRRAQRERAIERTYRWMKAYGLNTDEARVRRRAATPHPCSGACCGNPRRWWSGDGALTMQERRAREGDEIAGGNEYKAS
jgi:hypothetical protein